ncbi:lipocalin-like domain-containing protein [Cryptosporangium aurantiacum]|uniref:Lipocalin-like domain-containing protein n=1 Tax=Cryptosporangium aurantiacum TaxID=134849 RepID=A0A1M7R3H0_9ACTN|nr:lipocalin-like domain-containing protein [Cryptosporangium aurantiacum]SHN39682.1 Lipocalin-like domain-containing protein [Cryptosporangium aurantiacum]
MTKRRNMPFALVVAVVLALGLVASAPALARSDTAGHGTSSLVGAWRMTTLEVGTGGNLAPVPYSGQIIFTKSGNVSVQAMNPDPDAADTAYTVNGYEAFYGQYTVDKKAKTFQVTVQSAAVRTLIGQRLTRVFVVSRDTLVLTPADPAEGWRVTYERL